MKHLNKELNKLLKSELKEHLKLSLERTNQLEFAIGRYKQDLKDTQRKLAYAERTIELKGLDVLSLSKRYERENAEKLAIIETLIKGATNGGK